MNTELNPSEKAEAKTDVIASASPNIVIIGHGSIGHVALIEAIENSKRKENLIHIVQKKPADVIINGIGWNEKPKKQISGRMSSLISMLASFECFDSSMYYGNSYNRSLPKGINVIQEYGLIELKQSKLSKWERDAVKLLFERTFERAD